MKNPRFKKALRIAMIVGIIAAIPVILLVRYQNRGEVGQQGFGRVKPFYAVSKDLQNLSDVQLKNALTVVLYLPSYNCPEAECSQSRRNVELISNWIAENLSIRYTEERNPLKLIYFADEAIEVPNTWIYFPINSDRSKAPMPEDIDLRKNYAFVVDHNLIFRGIFKLDETFDGDNFQALTSKLVTDQYLANYLSKRTFFGPKKSVN